MFDLRNNLRSVHLLTHLYVNVNGIRFAEIHIEICFGPDIIFTALLLSNLSSTLVIASFIATPLSTLTSIHRFMYVNWWITKYWLNKTRSKQITIFLDGLRIEKLKYLYVSSRFQSRKILTYSLMINPFSCKLHFKFT